MICKLSKLCRICLLCSLCIPLLIHIFQDKEGRGRRVARDVELFSTGFLQLIDDCFWNLSPVSSKLMRSVSNSISLKLSGMRNGGNYVRRRPNPTVIRVWMESMAGTTCGRHQRPRSPGRLQKSSSYRWRTALWHAT